MAIELEPRVTSTCSTASRASTSSSVPGVGVQFLQFPVTNPLVADKRIRQAIYYAFDRKTLLETVFQGAGKLLWGPASFDLGRPGAGPATSSTRTRPRSSSPRPSPTARSIQTKPLRVIYYPEEPGWQEIAAALQNDLTAVGPERPARADRRGGLGGQAAGRDRLRDQPPVLRLVLSPGLATRAPSTARRRSVRCTRTARWTTCSRRPGRPVMPPSRPRSTRRSRKILNDGRALQLAVVQGEHQRQLDRASATSPTTRTRGSRSRRSRSGRWRA